MRKEKSGSKPKADGSFEDFDFEAANRKIYRKFLKSPEWKAIRERVFERDKYTCQACGGRGRPGNVLVAHHRAYGRFLHKQKMEDLITICQSCHLVWHESHKEA